MGTKSKSLALIFLLFFNASLVALPQNVKALAPFITLNSTEITERTVTLSWTSPYFLVTSYTLYISNASNYANGHPLNQFGVHRTKTKLQLL